MAKVLRATFLCALGLAAALLVACGDRNGLLPGDRAQSLNSALDRLDSALGAGDCPAAESAARSLKDAAGTLQPGSINTTLVSNINQGARTIAALTPRSCTTSTSTTTTPTTTTPRTTSTTTTPTTTTPTTTTPATTPTTTTPTPPPTHTTSTPSGNGGAPLPGNGGGAGGTP